MHRWRKRLLILIALGLIVGVSLFAYWEYRYPFGYSHCCDKQLYMALRSYASEHNGWFPRGEATPEASLSLLYVGDDTDRGANANLLRGKTISLEVTKKALRDNGKLSPETCGWHYVEGLRITDDNRLALFWDKVGLGHNGQRLQDGRFICRVNGEIDFIAIAGWDNFIAEQEELRKNLIRRK